MPSDNTDDGDGRDDVRDAVPQLDGSRMSSKPVPTASTKIPSDLDWKHQSTLKGASQNKKDSGILSWFSIPPPLKRLFDRFPLVTYDENASPLRSPRRRENTLYIFTTKEGSKCGRPSYNPSCLKWQTYLRIAKISFQTIASNNHASPNGVLPFLLFGTDRSRIATESSPASTLPGTVPGNKLKRWIQDTTKKDEPENMRYEAYASLLENAIRLAWLYQLYLNPANESVMKRLYVETCSTNPVVQLTIATQLKGAAEAEIVKAIPQSTNNVRIDESELMRNAEEAFAALSTLLGEDDWFFGSPQDATSGAEKEQSAGLSDASVFAYTHLILDSSKSEQTPSIGWTENPLERALRKHTNLVNHSERILEMYY